MKTFSSDIIGCEPRSSELATKRKVGRANASLLHSVSSEKLHDFEIICPARGCTPRGGGGGKGGG